MKTSISVADAMTRQPVVVTPSDTIATCAKIMTEKRVGSLLVKENYNLMGIVTNTDIIRKAVSTGMNLDNVPVSHIMTTDPHCISPEKDIMDAIRMFTEKGIKHLPVVSDAKSKQLHGFLTIKDVLKIQPDLFEHVTDMISIREEGHKLSSQSAQLCDSCGTYSVHLHPQDDMLLCSKCLM